MAKLTKKQQRELETILRHARAARDYIMRDNVVVTVRASVATTTRHYTRTEGDALYPVTKEYGSDLCRIDTAISQLETFLMINAR